MDNIERGICTNCNTTIYRRTRWTFKWVVDESVEMNTYEMKEITSLPAPNYERVQVCTYSATPHGETITRCPECHGRIGDEAQ